MSHTQSTSILDPLRRLGARRTMARRQLVATTFGVSVVAFVVVHASADGLLALPMPVRAGLDVIFVLGVIAWATRRWWRAGRFHPTEVAAASDPDDPRQTCLAAAELAESPPDSPMGEFFREKIEQQALRRLEQVSPDRFRDRAAWRRLWQVAAATLLAGLVLGLVFPRAVPVTLARVLAPWTDTPPFSPLVFDLDPAQPSALYGQDAVIRAHVTGGRLPGPVEARIRNGAAGNIAVLRPFQEDAQTFVVRLDKLTAPVQISFSSGRARSAWRDVRVVMEPKILGIKASVTPPSYSGRKAESFEVAAGEFTALQGSRIEVVLTSNRPLLRGTANAEAVEGGPAPVESSLEGKATPGAHEVRFTWTAAQSVRWKLNVFDPSGIGAPEPARLTVRVVPDQPPAAEMVEPSSLAFATPESVVPMAAEARDDLGLARLRLIRALRGYRDRPLSVADVAGLDRRVEQKVDLKMLGVSPGDTLEFFLEATDNNPSLTGIGTSAVASVKVISSADYAAAIRARTTMAEFRARYRMLQDQIDRALASLDQLEEALKANTKVDEALRHATGEHHEARQMLQKLADDFPAFELENLLKEVAGDMAEAIGQNRDEMGQADPNDTKSLKASLETWRDRLGKGQPEVDKIADEGNTAALAGDLAEMAARFREIKGNQESLVRRLDTLAREMQQGKTENRGQLPGLQRMQEQNQQALEALAKEMEEKLKGEAPEELKELADGAKDFLQRMHDTDPGQLMKEAARAAQDGRSADAAQAAFNALLMLDKLEKSKDDPFSQMLRGNQPDMPGNLEEALRDTIRQLADMMNQRGRGQGQGQGRGMGQGQGQGMGQGGADGFAMESNDMSKFPLFGPDRLSFGGGDGSGQEGGGQKPGRRPGAPRTEDGTIRPPDRKAETAGPVAPPDEPVPEAYREAVKRFFSQPDAPDKP